MESQHKPLLAALLLIGFLLLLRPVSATLSVVPLSNELANSVYTYAAAARYLSIQGERSWDGRNRKLVKGRKLMQVETNDYSPPGPNPTHDPGSPP